MDQIMKVVLTDQPAAAVWGKAVLSFTGDGALIHLADDMPLRGIQKAARKLRNQGVNSVQLTGQLWDAARQWAFHQGFVTAKGGHHIHWCGSDAEQQELQLRADCGNFARQLINETPENLPPVKLALAVAAWLQQLGGEHISYRIVEGEELLAQQWAGIYAVGRGSERAPALLELDYNPAGQDAPVAVALVGKGITFDSGGYSLKASQGMLGMKADMGGAATVAAALGLAIQRGLNKRVKLFLCCAENLVSGHAYKLGDIITYKNGTTVEVVNTDAEGRLVLADGLQAATEAGAGLIIDAATLTGAAVMAVSQHYNAIFSPQKAVLQLAAEKADAVAEHVWPLPLEPWHKEMCPSDYADTANSRPVKGGGAGGASNAAAFLWRFVGKDIPWLHMDLAAAFEDDANALWAAGATTHGMLTVAELLMD
ncbi:aminopeptidase PepB [Shewanella sp. YIC-542]|uniref:aminopeptidase PepB n=1 Tax=Shewanella mytili TaxID=3377111 RepID=UPI00398F67FD